MRKKTILKIERKLKARAKKMRLGKKRTGAYVYGTLRKLQKNQMITGEGIDRYRLLAIKQGLRARKIGMMVTRGATTKKLLGMLSQYTGEKYSSRDIDRGISDAEKLLKSDVDMTMQRKIASGVVQSNPRGVPKISDEAIRKMIKRYPASRRREAIFTLGISSGIPLSRIKRALKSNPATPQVDPPWNYGIYTGGGRVARRIPTKIERLRKIVSERQNAVIDGKRVDLYSASAIVSVYDKLNPENRVKFAKMPVGKMADVAFRIITAREVVKNPVNDVLEVLPLQQIAAEYKKGGEGQGSKLMFTSPPMSGSMAQKIVRMIGNYNEFTWRRVVPFLGMLDVANKSLTLPMKFRVGREYSPAIYIENVDMPRYANQIIAYARKRLKVSEADYAPVARRIRLWWD